VLNGVNHNRRTVGELIRALAQSRYTQEQRQPGIDREVAIVIPAYNEEDNIGQVLEALPDRVLGYAVRPLVVVDGSNDRTAEVVRQGGYDVALHVLNRGQGDALRTGFDIALSERADIVVTMDSDGQHRPAELGRLVKPVIDNEADFVMGSRMLGEYEDRGGSRHVGIVFFSSLISVLIGQRITDCTNGYRAIRGGDLGKLKLQESRFSAPELLIEAGRNRLRIREVPVTVVRRSTGASKKPPRLGYPLGFLRAIVQAWLR
jgi:glycosyltransferase involved in cell wall biosynthesis